ncbi:rhomboid family intramembrane serine protease GlpG [Paraferrimonas sedimenticola]|uniref:Rhomboid family intramembrane serine protease GlpG n=1 Tax=Paraferrimonas sedimenticola TaxID=375674 RepID=A0AA37W068_9GAMM|nr:rhomboid family intramembrane serine protease GlpG [Paraferrimonas sedimenticola]GLP95980.1 rhomboid family intramembrane serine protease GlpG [Paraferrimonas sedimenticola]
MQLGELPHSRAAQALVDYLNSQGIQARMQALADDRFVVEIAEAAQSQQAEQIWQEFIQDPNHPRYQAASWTSGDSKVKFSYRRGPSFAQQVVSGAGPLTLVVLATCLVIYGLAAIGFVEAIYPPLFFFEQLQPAYLGEFWRAFTPSLLHFSIVHLAFNLLWWWMLGGQIERQLGFGKLLLILLVAGTLPNFIQFFMTGPNFGGLSGVVYALMGYCWILGRLAPQAGVSLAPAYAGFMLFWLALGFMDVLGIPVANGAHLGGLLVGMAQAYIDSKRINRTGTW